MRIEKIFQGCAAVTIASTVLAMGIGAPRLGAQSKTNTAPACCTAKKQSAASKKPAAKFSARAETLLGAMPASKAECGPLIAEPESGRTLSYQHPHKHPAP